jgi:hypothetical protein
MKPHRIQIAHNLFELPPLKDDPKKQKRYIGLINRVVKRKDPKTGKLVDKVVDFYTDPFTDRAKAETALKQLQKDHPAKHAGQETPEKRLRTYLKELPEGSTVNRSELIKEYFPDTKHGRGPVRVVLNEFKHKKFKIIRTPRAKGEFTRIKLTPKERRVLNTAYSKEYKGLKGIELLKAMALKEDLRGHNIIKYVRSGQENCMKKIFRVSWVGSLVI